jgi:hypothetical protein
MWVYAVNDIYSDVVEYTFTPDVPFHCIHPVLDWLFQGDYDCIRKPVLQHHKIQALVNGL